MRRNRKSIHSGNFHFWYDILNQTARSIFVVKGLDSGHTKWGIGMYKTITIAAVALIAMVGFFNYNAYTISLNATTSTVTPNPATVALGAPITLHVKVVDTSTTKIIATGTVSWSDGGAGGVFGSSGSCTLAPVSGSTSSATCSIVYTAPANTNPVTITANYLGDSNHMASSGTSSLSLTLRAAKTSISPNPSGTAIGVPITFRAKIADTSAGTKIIPSGTVSWSDGGAGGSFSLASCTLAQFGTSTSTGTCTIVYTPPSSTGPVTITGTYSGDSTHTGSSGKSALTVNLRTTSTVVTPNPATGTIGKVMTFKAVVTDTRSGTKTLPGGTVSWSDGGAGGTFSSASCTLVFATADKSQCTVTYTPSSGGSATITATYSGDSTHAASSGISALTVNLRTTSTVITPNPATTGVGTTITLKVVVTDISSGIKGVPSGTVSWSDGGLGGDFIGGSCTLVPATGDKSVCSIIYAPSSPGILTITATYSGDTIFSTSFGTSSLTGT